MLILVDFCGVNYQTLSLTWLKLIIKIAKHAWREKNIKLACDFIVFENNRLNYKCKECKGTSTESINDLIEKFPNIYQFCNGDLNQFILLLRKSVYPHENMDSWERFNETSLPPKKDFYSELTLEDISKKTYNHAQKVFEEYCMMKTLVIIMICMFKLIHYCL